MSVSASGLVRLPFEYLQIGDVDRWQTNSFDDGLHQEMRLSLRQRENKPAKPVTSHRQGDAIRISRHFHGVPAERCPAIERATNGQVRCEDLRPDVDWAVLRCQADCQKEAA